MVLLMIGLLLILLLLLVVVVVVLVRGEVMPGAGVVGGGARAVAWGGCKRHGGEPAGVRLGRGV